MQADVERLRCAAAHVRGRAAADGGQRRRGTRGRVPAIALK
jgi:hypothetical protein